MIAQTPWIERQFQFDFPVGLFPVIFSRLEGTIFRLQRIFTDADDALCSHKNKGWSVKEHLGHLTDLETLWWQRLDDFRRGSPLLSAADMTNAKTNAANHNNKSIELLLEEFIEERQKMLVAIYDFGEDMLCTTAMHPRLQKSMRVIDSLYFVAEHDDHHIAFISEAVRKA